MFDDSAAGVKVERRPQQSGAEIEEDQPGEQESGNCRARPSGGSDYTPGFLVSFARVFRRGDLRQTARTQQAPLVLSGAFAAEKLTARRTADRGLAPGMRDAALLGERRTGYGSDGAPPPSPGESLTMESGLGAIVN